jgi:serine/threonine-protein kinase
VIDPAHERKLVDAGVLVPRGPRLPDGLKLAGRKVPAADGKEVDLYLWKLPDGSDMEMVYVPAGTFVMGAGDSDAYDDEKPKHTHRLDHAYWIGRNDVTWGQYLAFCKAKGQKEPEKPWFWDRVPGTKNDHPVVMVSWDDAKAYSAWARGDKLAEKVFGLPTEVEWEKAARGESGRTYPWGNDWDPGSRSNFADRSCPMDDFNVGDKKASEWIKQWGGWDKDHTDGYAFTSPIGSFPAGASPYGALDMAGNVWQWCEDWYEEKAYGRYEKGDMSDPPGGSYRVLRGGGWGDSARGCRSSSRDGIAPGARRGDLGFRVLLRSVP